MGIKERIDGLEFRYGDRDNDGAMNRAEFRPVESMLINNVFFFKIRLVLTFFFPLCTKDPNEFNRYDTNRDGLVDTLEYARGEAQERQCKIN